MKRRFYIHYARVLKWKAENGKNIKMHIPDSWNDRQYVYIQGLYNIYLFKFTRERHGENEQEDVLCTPLQQGDLINTAINHGWQWWIYLTWKPDRVQNQQFISRRNSDRCRSIRAPNVWLPMVAAYPVIIILCVLYIYIYIYILYKHNIHIVIRFDVI